MLLPRGLFFSFPPLITISRPKMPSNTPSSESNSNVITTKESKESVSSYELLLRSELLGIGFKGGSSPSNLLQFKTSPSPPSLIDSLAGSTLSPLSLTSKKFSR